MTIAEWWRNRGRSSSVFPADENGDVLWRMHRCGDDLSKKRRVDFAFLFTTERCARDFQPKAEALGFEVEVSLFSAKASWDVQCSIAMMPTHRNVCHAEKQLSALAALGSGKADGWGCMAQ